MDYLAYMKLRNNRQHLENLTRYLTIDQIAVSIPLEQCFLNFFVQSPPFHSRHVGVARKPQRRKHKVVFLKNFI